MPKQIFVNLPVKDLKRSVNFFTNLGFKFDPQFTDDKATCMIVNENIYVMLLEKSFFKAFTSGKEVADAFKTTEVLVCLSMESRAGLDALVNKAVTYGAKELKAMPDEVKASMTEEELKMMYGRTFEDLDGHIWEMMFMNIPEASKK